MPAYHYTAVNIDGAPQKGVIEAESERQVREQLRAQGFFPTGVQLAKSVSSGKRSFWQLNIGGPRRLSAKAVALFTRQFATLLSAGLPVEEALLAVSQQSEQPAVKALILSVRASVMEGHALGKAMEAHPNAFSSLYCATVSAGERTGHLDQVLLRLADYTEQQANISQKLKTALIYPTMIVCVAFGIVGFLLAYVVPKMVAVYGHMKQALPVMTSVLIALSNGMQAFGLYVLLALVGGVFLFRYCLKRNKALRLRWHLVLLRLPLIGFALKTADTARFARTLSVLSSAGVPVLEAMQVSSQLMTLMPLRSSVEVAVGRVREGAAIHLALKNTGYFSPMCVHMIASGEASGQLDQLLERVAKQQEEEVTRLIDVSLALFEPAIILIMGAIVLFIVLAVLLPIFQLNEFTG